MLKFFVSLRKRFDLNMKEIHPGQNGLGFPFFILLLNWVVRRIDADLSIAQIFLDNSCPLNFLKFLASWARSLKIRPLVIS